MAHGEAARPIEVKDGKVLDSSQQGGYKSLSVHDAKIHDLLEQIYEGQQKIIELLEMIAG